MDDKLNELKNTLGPLEFDEHLAELLDEKIAKRLQFLPKPEKKETKPSKAKK